MKRNVLIFGSLIGVLLSINMVYMVYQCYTDPNYNHNIVLAYAIMLVLLSPVYFGIKNYRDKQLNSIISLGGAFKCGALIVLLGATIYVITWLFAYYIFVPDFMDKYTMQELKRMVSSGAPIAEISRTQKEMESYKEMYKNPFWVIVMTYIEVLPLGLLVAFISALALKQKSISK